MYHTVFRIGTWRCPAAGIAYLQWAALLKIDETCAYKNDPNFEQPTSQALAAQETFTLYKWWKEERPKRVDPSEESGWKALCEEKAREDDSLCSSFITNKMKDELSRYILSIYHQIEKEQEEEDTAMLIRLVKIRKNLWV